MSEGNGNGHAITLGKADFQSSQETRWCPGCGDYAVLAAVQKLMPELGIPPHRVVAAAGAPARLLVGGEVLGGEGVGAHSRSSSSRSSSAANSGLPSSLQ